MNRSVLIVTPYFAPQSHAAVFRAYKLAKYLPKLGWKPFVLTVDRNYLYNEDQALLESLPPEVEIVTARYIEPSIRGARMALGGQDRTFASKKERGEFNKPDADCSAISKPSTSQEFYRRVRESWLQVPDAYWTWRGPAIRAARKLIRRHSIPIIYTTCLPFTCLDIGRTLQGEGCRWVADFRDPATYSSRMFSPVDRVYMKQRRLERMALRSADAVTVLSSAYAMILRDMYAELGNKAIHFIPTGLDEDLLPCDTGQARRVGAAPYIAFSGEFLPEYGDAFFKLFANALAVPKVSEQNWKLLIIGHGILNRERIGPFVDKYGLAPHVQFLDHMPQSDLYRLLQSAEAGLLIPGFENHWWNNFAKLVDYIALRKPVLAMVPDPSEARSRLTAAGLGIFLDGDFDACAAKLTSFLSGRLVLPTPNEDECGRYLATKQVKAFVEVFDEVLR